MAGDNQYRKLLLNLMLPKAPLANGLTNTKKNASIDLYDRSAVASLNSDYINTDLAISTLKTALEKENYENGV